MPESTEQANDDKSSDESVATETVKADAATTKNEDNSNPVEKEKSAEAEPDDWAAAMAEQSSTETTKSDAVANTQKTTPVFEQFPENGVLTNAHNNIDMILDIPVQLTVELGRTKIAIKSLLQLAQGSVIELDGMAGEPMDVLVNGCLIAQGEVVVVNDKFGIRLTDIITPSERIRKLNR